MKHIRLTTVDPDTRKEAGKLLLLIVMLAAGLVIAAWIIFSVLKAGS